MWQFGGMALLRSATYNPASFSTAPRSRPLPVASPHTLLGSLPPLGVQHADTGCPDFGFQADDTCACAGIGIAHNTHNVHTIADAHSGAATFIHCFKIDSSPASTPAATSCVGV